MATKITTRNSDNALSYRLRAASIKRYLLILFIMLSYISCSEGSSGTLYPPSSNQTTSPPSPSSPTEKGDSVIRITVGSKQYKVSLYDNQTAATFKAMLPLTLNMIEMNNNEKYYDLSQSLPTSATRVNNIYNGDLLLFGSSTLVLFYKSFSTSYSYTPIGRVDNPIGLEAALGRRSVSVTFELIKKE